MTITDVAIIGAGPYGLSIAAHLLAKGVNLRIFGNPMQTWRTQMPKGMFLKSEGFASDLYDPKMEFRLSHYCEQQNIEYGDIGLPVALDTFASYGMAFQRKFVPDVEHENVTKLSRFGSRFELQFADGGSASARRVVVAAGITHYGYLPPELRDMPGEVVSHSSRHHSLESFKGKTVAVLGAGSSAIDIAAILYQVGAAPELVTRRQGIGFPPPPPANRTLLQKFMSPQSVIGAGWHSRLATDLPLVFHQFPEEFRLRVVGKHLGPAPCWFMRDHIVGKVPMHVAVELRRAEIDGDRVRLHLAGPDREHELVVDHVIAATGYRVDLTRLAFLREDLLGKIRSVQKTPVLSSTFESSIPDLHFVGASSANSFGPLVRFACGARFTARRLSRHLASLH